MNENNRAIIFNHLLIHFFFPYTFNEYLLSSRNALGTLLDFGEASVSKTNIPYLKADESQCECDVRQILAMHELFSKDR